MSGFKGFYQPLEAFLFRCFVWHYSSPDLWGAERCVKTRVAASLNSPARHRVIHVCSGLPIFAVEEDRTETVCCCWANPLKAIREPKTC